MTEEDELACGLASFLVMAVVLGMWAAKRALGF